MPNIKSRYSPLKVFRNGFLSTVYSGIIRHLKIVQKRERIKLEDGDFLDLDWSYASKHQKN